MEKIVDLHIHSSYSDGQYTPDMIIEEALKNNVGIISIADHDDINAYKDISMSNYDKIEIINGIEISSMYISKKNEKIPIHILGYDLDIENSSLIEKLNKLKDYRNEVNTEYIKNILTLFKFLPEDTISHVDCKRYCRIGWAIIKYLEKQDISEENLSEVKKYCRKNYPNYKNYDVDAKEVIELIKNANGIPVLAHPYSYKLNDLEVKRMIKRLIEYGIEGVEAYHSECSLENMKKLRMLVESYKLLYSCGSDFHFHTEVNNKIIGHGINENLCLTECSLSTKILGKRKKI